MALSCHARFFLARFLKAVRLSGVFLLNIG